MDILNNIDDKLRAYLALLRKWQPKINLISNGTLETAWERHFQDSLQLLEIISVGQKTLFDLGSGAGFPGLVLAMARDDLSVHLVESDQKKCVFLKTVSRETKTDVIIHNQRIESVSREIVPDIISARALAALPKLFDYCRDWIMSNSDLTMIFPKGENADQELVLLKEKWQFDLCTYDSKTDRQAKILVFSNVCEL